jgi:hypothetical protein
MALVFPATPTPGQRIPTDPGTSGVSQYEWNNTKGVWNTVATTVSLGVANQDAFNAYQWPLTDGAPNKQLTTDGAGNLSWDVTAVPSLQMLGVLEPFDGVNTDFTLIELGSSPVVPFTPVPSTNIVVFLGGVPQLPTISFIVLPSTNTLRFQAPPLAGSTFYAISSIVTV